MPDFIRKQRNLNYRDLECRRYIRKDFNKRCAYCGIREGDLAGEDDFQIDHFIPISKGGEDLYDNLFYSCVTCNGKAGKSDYISKTLLNPCKDDIFNNGRIFLNDEFYYVYRDERGKEFINAIKLNRLKYIQRRKNNHQYRLNAEKKIREMEQLIEKIEDERLINIIKETIQESKNIIENGRSYLETFNEDDRIEELLEKELSKFCNFKKLNENFNIDYIIKRGDKKLYIHNVSDKINFKSDRIIKRIKNADIEKWGKMDFDVKLIYFDNSTKLFYFANIPIKHKDIENNEINIFKSNRLDKHIFD